MNNSFSNLLPVGFYDLLFEEAENNHYKVNKVLDYFLKKNYRLIKTPLVEFSDNFSREDISNSFIINDVISGKNLVLRNDITLQISRLFATKLKDAQLPLKLCYVGDVLLSRSEKLYADRQLTQIGAEIIGCNNEESNFEIIELILDILPKISTEKLIIEFSLPNFANLFFRELEIENPDILLVAVRKKDLSQIKNLAGKFSDLICKIVISNNNLQEISAKISTILKSAIIDFELEKAIKILNIVSKKFPELQIYFDLFGDHKTLHYKNIAFDIFCGDFSYPVARGGRYNIGEIDAVGATIYINHLRKLYTKK